MAKKHWISVKRGLSEDPKHRERMGMAVWVFLHMLDRADWETGRVYNWRDKDEASDMCMPERTLRDWRQRLSELGYICCIQRQHGQDIVIFNWLNPRDYSAGVINRKGATQDDTYTAPSEFQGATQDDMPASSESVIPTLSSEAKNQPIEKEDENLSLLRRAAKAIWPRDPLPWRKMEADLAGARIERTDHRIIVCGLGEEKSAFYQDRFSRLFERQLLGIVNEPIELIFST